MYTSYIGNKFLAIYRERNRLPEDYTAKQFFDEVLFPLFFDDEEHLMHVGNSPFFQKPTKKAVDEHGSKSKAQLFNLRSKIEEGIPSGAIYVGYGAESVEATSSGQMTSMSLDLDSDEIYASWIGQALAIGVSGGLAIHVAEDELLWTIYNGWRLYRRYLQQTPKLKDKQIETWNGQWINHAFSKLFYEADPFADFGIEPENVLGKLAIPTIDWVKIVFALSRKYPDQVLTAYVYNLSQTNTTLGFINIYLPKVQRLIRLKEKIYTLSEDGRNDRDFEDMYNTFYNFKNACMLGTIGLKALEPSKLRDFMPKGTAKYAKGNDYRFADIRLKQKKGEPQEAFEERLLKAKNKYSEDLINFRIYKTWILAMLNNKKELNALAEQVAQALIDFEDQISASESGRGKSTSKRLSDELKSSKSLKVFIDNLTALMAQYKESAATFKKVKDAVIQLPGDLFPLFITLIRFEYQFKKSI